VSSARRPDHPVAAAFERRAARAESLAAESGGAAEALCFASGLYRVQAHMAAHMAALHAASPLTGRLHVDMEAVAAGVPELLHFAADHGPRDLAEAARLRLQEASSSMSARLAARWAPEAGAPLDYLSRAALRPYVELLAHLRVPPDRPRHLRACPFCGGLPWIAARRAEAEGEGAGRHLGCPLCGGEWRVNRVCCPCCAEEDPARLPAFASASCPAVRIEACETCGAYVKSIDLTLDARAIPEVDDLASLAFDLWAAREGFQRIEPGLAGPAVVGAG
jgi:formate dehydrogenase accessory protein FdhE